jgi:hypothetical protein
VLALFLLDGSLKILLTVSRSCHFVDSHLRFSKVAQKSERRVKNEAQYILVGGG